MTALALYTTVYPGVERYLAAWHRSVRAQTDQDFQLWIGLDKIGIEAATGAMGGDPGAIWVPGARGDTPAQVRQRALAQIVGRHDGVVLVDSDDVLHPARLAVARAMLDRDDVAGCALRLVDQEGQDMGLTFGLPPQSAPEDVLPRNNVFGLSNSALRADLLRRCLPIPPTVALVDWFLATRAWLFGARMAFDNEVGMDYRQHGANMVRVIPPFQDQQVAQDTERVRRHFQIVQTSPIDGALSRRLARLARVAEDIEVFHERVATRPARLRRYVRALNALETAPLWWSCVANPSLRHMWTSEEEAA